MSSRFSSNSEANASELPEKLEEMFPRYTDDRVWIISNCIQFVISPP